MSRYVLALDQGTSSSRAVLVDHAGEIAGIASRPLTSSHPAAGAVEQDPAEIWATTAASMHEVLKRAGVSASDLAAVGVTNQRQTTVPWRRSTGEPLGPAMVWQSRASEPQCERLRGAGHASRIEEVTGLPVDPCFTATKIQWLLENNPPYRDLAAAGDVVFGTVDAWLIANLTGGAVVATDASNASGTMLYNLRSGDWSDELLDLYGVERAWLPEVRPSSGVFGTTTADVLGAAIPVAGVAGDQQAALFGQCCTREGEAKTTFGTGAFFLMNAGREVPPAGRGLLTSVAWDLGDGPEYAAEGFIMSACTTFHWLSDRLGFADSPQAFEALAAGVPSSNGVSIVPAFSGLAAPHWRPDTRATLTGVTAGVGRGELARAAYECVAHQVCDVLAITDNLPTADISELRADGGAANSDLLMQLQADLSGRPVVRPTVTEATARGAAFLAGLAVGFWSGAEELRCLWRVDRRFEPSMPAADRGQLRGQWAKAVRQCLTE